MLQIKNLTISHKKDLKNIIENFTFVLNDGDKAVIIGEEGNGKSTLLKLIYDESLVTDYVDYSGKIIKNNTKFGYLAQELPNSQKEKSIYDFFFDIPEFSETTPAELFAIARQLGFTIKQFYSEQIVRTLSGGEKVKLQLAKILILKPDVLLLDEPSNDIDIETLEWLEHFINNCKLPVLFVSHDETLVENTANIIIHLELVRRKTLPLYTIAKMPYKQYAEERLANLMHQEQVAKNEQSEYEKQQEKLRQIQQKVDHQLNTISRGDPHGGRLLKKKMKNVKAMEKRFEKEHENRTQRPDVEEAIMVKFNENINIPNGKTVLSFKLDKLFVEKTLLSENIVLNVCGNEKICIVGKNGVGKTTLLKMIAEELLQRQDIKAAYMPQNYEDLLDFEKTPIKFLSSFGNKDEITKIRTFLGSIKYTTDEMEHAISEMSGGQKAKLLFMKMILDGNNVLLLDEPTRNFSPISNPVIREVLHSFQGAIISISHDRKYINEVCGKVYEMTEKGLQLIKTK